MILKSILASAVAVAVLGNVSAAVFLTSGASTASDPLNAGSAAVIFYAGSTAYTIDSLGVFAPTGTENLTVSLWVEGSGSPVRSITIPTGSPDGTGFVYATIPSYLTAANGHYALAVTGYTTTGIGDTDAPYLDGPAAYNGALQSAVAGIFGWDGATNPYNFSSTTSSRFTIASFTATPVPEPEVYASIAGLALVGFGLYRRQVRK